MCMDRRIRLVHRKLTNKNLHILDTLDEKCFPFDEKYNKINSIWWIAYYNNIPVGFAGISIRRNKAFFCRAGILSKYRNLGIHQKLIEKRLKYCSKKNIRIIYTYCLKDNTVSINNLSKLGFVKYKTTRTWITLWKIKKRR